MATMAKKTKVEIVGKTDLVNQIGDQEIQCNMSDGSVWVYSRVNNTWRNTSPTTAELQKSFNDKE